MYLNPCCSELMCLMWICCHVLMQIITQLLCGHVEMCSSLWSEWVSAILFHTKGRQTILLKQRWPCVINALQLKKCWNQLGRLRYSLRPNWSGWKSSISAITEERFVEAEGKSQTDNWLLKHSWRYRYSHYIYWIMHLVERNPIWTWA